MATAFSSLRARLFALLGLALLLLLVPLALVSVKEAEKAAAEDLERAIFSRLFLLKEEGPKEEALLLELFRLSQTYGGGVGFVVRGEEVRFTELQDWPLPEPLLLALREGRPYQGVWRGVLYVALPEEGGGFGLAVLPGWRPSSKPAPPRT
jgi:two-component system sensor histidine kinase TctE